MPQRLAQHLIARGLLPARTVDEALKRLAQRGGTLDTALLELGAISEAGMLQAVSDVSGVRLVNLADFEPNTDAGPQMPVKMARQLNVVPLSLDGNALHIASAYPISVTQLKDLGFLLGRKVELWVALECRVKDWQAVLYREPLEERYASLLAMLDPSRPPLPAVGEKTLDGPPDLESIEAESLSSDVLERIARGIVEEPLLLDRPKASVAENGRNKASVGENGRNKASVAESGRSTASVAENGRSTASVAENGRSKPSVAPSSPRAPEPSAPRKPPAQIVELGDDDQEEVRTSVLEPIAYEAFARSEDGADTSGDVFLSEHESTRVLDVRGYSNFAREVTKSPTPSAPQPPPKITFPGGVLPPRKPSSDSSPPFKKPSPPPTFVKPASAPRPTAELKRAPEPVPPSSAVDDPDLDFSEVSAVLKGPVVPIVVPPPPPEVRPVRPSTSAPPSARPTAKRPPPPMPPATPPSVRETPIGPSSPTPPVHARTTPPTIAPVTRAPAAAHSMSGMLGSAPLPSAPSANSAILPAPPGLSGSNALEWSLAQARTSLRAATSDREHLVSVILEYGRRTFDFVAAFAVMRGAAIGWDARSVSFPVDANGKPPLSVTESLRQVAIPLDAASVFRTVALTRGSYVGPLPPDALSQHYLAVLGRSPRTVFLWPVEVQSRLVAVLYGDCGSRPVSQRRLSDFILFCQDLPNAFHELILHRKQNPQVAQTLVGDDAPGAPPLEFSAAEVGLHDDADWFNGLITLLTGPDPSERSMAMVEFMKTPQASAEALAYSFPGPTGWSRLPVVELPEPDELGPIPGALARLGQAGAAALAPLLDSSDSDTRYLALLTAGALRYPEVISGVLRGLFDDEPDISSASRAAAAQLKYLPHFQHRVPELRQELGSTDALRRSLAARALGVLHDREGIDALINLTGSEDELCAQSAADALKEITRAGFGTSPTLWSQWWARARDHRRIEWLVDALDADDFDLRLAAIEELSRTFGDNYGYFADGPDAERNEARARWQAIVTSRLDLDL